MTFLRPIFSIISLLILAAAIYLLWSWHQGELMRRPDGTVELHRDDWRLWCGGILTLWSLLGRFLYLLLLAKPDPAPVVWKNGVGIVVEGANGERLNVQEFGPPDAPLILLTHGWSLDHTVWQYAVQDLSRDFRVVTWDLPGLGKSTATEISLSAFAADLKILLDRHQRPVLLVGHSIGGMTIQTLLRNDPTVQQKGVAGIVLVNTTYTNPLKTIVLGPLFRALRWPLIEPMLWLQIALKPITWLMSWQSYLSGSAHLTARLGFGRYVTRSQLDHTAWLMTVNSPSVQARGDLAMFRWDATAALPRISVPALVLGGEMDIVTLPEASNTIAQYIPRAQLQLFSGANHMGFIERAVDYNALIRVFAEKVLSPPKAVEPTSFETTATITPLG
ncbi:alpha/beta hydrolase [Rhizobium sp. XQZ8]|uniref:alpha/beta fold hydrolase n=1 Tax=Rhizobium populisoli TaxID=2859785 RepID=UPI001C682074|nr:alpha/beta hydrolase [Rhizobium populisoli]MBW6426075.1 alpha/beta hydrolase [Rhizobium populisoli]